MDPCPKIRYSGQHPGCAPQSESRFHCVGPPTATRLARPAAGTATTRAAGHGNPARSTPQGDWRHDRSHARPRAMATQPNQDLSATGHTNRNHARPRAMAAQRDRGSGGRGGREGGRAGSRPWQPSPTNSPAQPAARTVGHARPGPRQPSPTKTSAQPATRTVGHARPCATAHPAQTKDPAGGATGTVMMNGPGPRHRSAGSKRNATAHSERRRREAPAPPMMSACQVAPAVFQFRPRALVLDAAADQDDHAVGLGQRGPFRC